MESRRDKFVRIAESRTNKILYLIKLLGNCSNKSTYEYTSKDVDKIVNAIENELKRMRSRYISKDENKIYKFSLKEE